MLRLGLHFVAPRQAALLSLEALGAWLAFFFVASAARAAHPLDAALGASLAVTVLAFALSLADLHDLRTALEDARGARLLRAIGGALLVAALVLLALAHHDPRPSLAVAGLPAAALAPLGLRAVLPRIDRRFGLRARVFLVGDGLAAHRLVREIQRDGAVEIVGFCGPRSGAIARKARQAGAGEVVLATDDRRGLDVDELLACRVSGLPVRDAALFCARALRRLPVELVRPSDLILGDGFTASWLTRLGRRLLSMSAALALLVFAAPLLGIAALAIRIDTRGPILFRQRRVGCRGRVYQMLKLRTMTPDAEGGAAKWAQKNDARITRVGRVLRRFRVDELPQLWNVLGGDMELVGPRPERPEFVRELRRRIPYYDLRHLVPPGITGWAQVCYPYAASVEEAREKLQYDLYYVRHASVGFDLFILLLTGRTVLLGRGAR